MTSEMAVKNPSHEELCENLTGHIAKLSLGSSSNQILFQDSNNRTDGSSSDSANSSGHYSRYQNDFKEVKRLGAGGFGCVMKVINKTDGQEYAVKKIKLRNQLHDAVDKRIVQEAKLLATLNHGNVVRYFSSWIETGIKRSPSSEYEWSSKSDSNDDKVAADDSKLDIGETPSDDTNLKANSTLMYLFIQMEICTKTLRMVIDETINGIPEELVAQYFFEIVKGMKYIHGEGFIHRDLNPSNIFLDAEGRIKIGDFGLAKECLSEVNNAEPLKLSKDVGTPAYIAPEITKNEFYDNRVDLYSLGITLFEMSYVMKSKHERSTVLEQLRCSDVIFPDDFPKYVSDWQATIIKSLLSHSADERFSLDRLLLILTEKFPLQDTNIPEFMGQALLEPSSRSYKQVLSSCFNQVAKQEEAINYDFLKKSYDAKTHFSVNTIVKCIEAVFLKHGASRVSTPLLTPKHHQQSELSSVVHLLTCDGLVVNLPYNARVGFARYVVWHNISRLIRYDTLQTYREHGSRSHPRPKYECVFDIITPNQESLVTDAQLLSVLASVCEALPWKENIINCVILINHTDIVKAILLSIGVREQHLPAALELIGKTGNWDNLQNLKPDQVNDQGLDIIKLNRMLNISDPVLTERTKALLLYEISTDCKKMVEGAFSNLQTILRYCIDFNVRSIATSMRWCSKVNYYSGVFFTAFCANDRNQRIILADGGRYDNVLLSFRDDLAQEKCDLSFNTQYGVGLSVYPTKVLQIQQDIWSPDLVVVACRKDEGLEKKVFDLAQVLRTMGLNCRTYFDVEASDIPDYAADENVMCFVEYLPNGKTNITHKAITKLEPPYQDVYGYVPYLVSPTVQIPSVQEEVINMVTLNFQMAV